MLIFILLAAMYWYVLKSHYVKSGKLLVKTNPKRKTNRLAIDQKLRGHWSSFANEERGFEEKKKNIFLRNITCGYKDLFVSRVTI